MSAFMLASKPWSIAAQGMFQLREINQMEHEMCQYLERGHGQEEFPSPPTTNPFPPPPAAHTPHIAPATQCAFSHCSSQASSNHPLFVSAFMLASKPWSIAAQGMPQLREINQMECEMYNPSSYHESLPSSSSRFGTYAFIWPSLSFTTKACFYSILCRTRHQPHLHTSYLLQSLSHCAPAR
ncbi:hypothetical protein F4604DRAFT_1936502 [Suillus subluteus]|nr:hypothetical protein F4604DRAFT_1936502 [Suillus subluteus]